MQDNDPMLYRFAGELFVGPGIGFFGQRLQCELWASADELFLDIPRKAVVGSTMSHFLDQRFKRGGVRLHYPARLWLLNIGIRIHAGNLAANRIAIFIPGPLENPAEIFARLDSLGWGKVHAAAAAPVARVAGG